MHDSTVNETFAEKGEKKETFLLICISGEIVLIIIWTDNIKIKYQNDIFAAVNTCISIFRACFLH